MWQLLLIFKSMCIRGGAGMGPEQGNGGLDEGKGSYLKVEGYLFQIKKILKNWRALSNFYYSLLWT